MPETKTPQKFPRCEKCGTTLEPSELVNGYFCPNEKCDRGAIAEEKPSLHPTDDEIKKVLIKWCANWDTAYKDWNFREDRPMQVTKKELKKLATLAFEAGQKSVLPHGSIVIDGIAYCNKGEYDDLQGITFENDLRNKERWKGQEIRRCKIILLPKAELMKDG